MQRSSSTQRIPGTNHRTLRAPVHTKTGHSGLNIKPSPLQSKYEGEQFIKKLDSSHFPKTITRKPNAFTQSVHEPRYFAH